MSATLKWPQASKKIKTVVAALVSMIAEMENPFIDDTKDLFSLDTKVVMDASAVELVNRMLLAASIKKFIEESLKETSAAVLSHTIFKNGFATFKTMFRESSQKGWLETGITEEWLHFILQALQCLSLARQGQANLMNSSPMNIKLFLRLC